MSKRSAVEAWQALSDESRECFYTVIDVGVYAQGIHPSDLRRLRVHQRIVLRILRELAHKATQRRGAR